MVKNLKMCGFRCDIELCRVNQRRRHFALKQFGSNRWKHATFHVALLLLSTIIYMTPIPCRRKSVKRKKMRKHQKHRHPRRMTAIQRCPSNRFSWEYSVSLKLLGRLQSDIPNSINKRLRFKSNILPHRIMMVSLGFFLIYGLLIWFFFKWCNQVVFVIVLSNRIWKCSPAQSWSLGM